jgi:ABC transporter substrate binding protein
MFGKANALTPIDTLLSAGWEGAKTFGERMTPLTGAQRIQISSTCPGRRHNRDENVMIHHLSIAARDPRHVAEVLAEFMGGAATRFTPNPGSWFAHQHDEYGTGVEVYPAGTELRPAGPEGAGFAMTEPIRSRYSPTHFALSASGIIPRLDRPNGNVTGFANLEASLGGKWIELLSEIAPGLKRAAIMFNRDTVTASLYVPSLETAARSLKVVPIIAPVHSDGEIETAIIAVGREPGGGLVVLPDVFGDVHRATIILAAARNSVPAVYHQSFFARDGGLLSYGPDQIDIFRRAATYVDRILRGANPGDLPVQFPTKFEMAVNLKTTKALGLTVPQLILLRTDEVIE